MKIGLYDWSGFLLSIIDQNIKNCTYIYAYMYYDYFNFLKKIRGK